MLGRIHAEQSDPAGAAESLQHALARPDQWHGAERPDRVAKLLARFLLRTGRPDQARDAIHHLDGWADDPEACWLLSRCDLQKGLATVAAIVTQARVVSRSPPSGARAGPVRRRDAVPEMPQDQLSGPAPQPACAHLRAQGTGPVARAAGSAHRRSGQSRGHPRLFPSAATTSRSRPASPTRHFRRSSTMPSAPGTAA